MTDKSIQEEIREGLAKILGGPKPPGRVIYEWADEILKYLDSKGVAVRVCEGGETAWAKIPYELCKWERLVEE